MHVNASNHVPTNLRTDTSQQPSGEAAQLCRPGGRFGFDGELTVFELHRPAVAAEVATDQHLPGTEDPCLGGRPLPSAGLDKLRQQLPQWLRIPRVGSGTRVAA